MFWQRLELIDPSTPPTVVHYRDVPVRSYGPGRVPVSLLFAFTLGIGLLIGSCLSK